MPISYLLIGLGIDWQMTWQVQAASTCPLYKAADKLVRGGCVIDSKGCLLSCPQGRAALRTSLNKENSTECVITSLTFLTNANSSAAKVQWRSNKPLCYTKSHLLSRYGKSCHLPFKVWLEYTVNIQRKAQYSNKNKDGVHITFGVARDFYVPPLPYT